MSSMIEIGTGIEMLDNLDLNGEAAKINASMAYNEDTGSDDKIHQPRLTQNMVHDTKSSQQKKNLSFSRNAANDFNLHFKSNSTISKMETKRYNWMKSEQIDSKRCRRNNRMQQTSNFSTDKMSERPERGSNTSACGNTKSSFNIDVFLPETHKVKEQPQQMVIPQFKNNQRLLRKFKESKSLGLLKRTIYNTYQENTDIPK